jgi:hypothetical protein
MHPALWQLLWFDFRGSFRGLLDVRKNWRQIFLLLMMLLFVGLFVGLQQFGTAGASSGRFGNAMPFWALVYLLATWLTASADRGLVLRPAEIQFVVGGPFAEHEVITLTLIRLAFRALISAMVLSLVALAYVGSYLSALVGMWLLMSVSLLVGMIASLSSRSAQRRTVAVCRRAISLVAIGSMLLLISQATRVVDANNESPSVSIIADSAMQTPVGRIILPPLAWMFAPLSSARFFPDTILLLPARLAVIGLLVSAIYLLGGKYSEASTRRTDASVAKRQIALRSGVAGGIASTGWTRRLSCPSLPRAGGLGSVAWMQVTHSLRILPRYVLFTAAIVGVVLVIPLMLDANRLSATRAVGWMVGLTAYADFLLLLQLPVGFLGPLPQREMLKSLPVASWRIVVGQLAGPLLPLAVLHSLVGGLFLVLLPHQIPLVLQTCLALVPIAAVLVANVNLLGSWNVIRPRALQQRDALAAGRAMASVWIFMAMLTPAIIIASLSATVLTMLLSPTLGNYLLGISVGMAGSCWIYVYLLTRSFERWQPSSGEAGQEEAEYDR